MTVDDPSGTVAIFKLWPRRWGLGLYADDRGLTYRRLTGTSRFDWAEISYFEDGSWADGQPGGVHWVLHIVLRTGRKVPVYCKPTSETLAAVMQVATRHGIPARLAGEVPKPLVQVVPKRRWRARD